MNNQFKTVWISRCDHMGDLLVTLPLICELSKHVKINIVVENYLFSLAQKILNPISVITTDDFCKIKQFSKEDIFIPLNASKKVLAHANRFFLGRKLGYLFRPKDWFYANTFSTLLRSYSKHHESKLLFIFIAKIFPKLTINTDSYLNTSYLKKFALNIEKKPSNSSHFKKIVIIHPGSNANGREWPVNQWIQLIKHLASLNIDIHLTGRGSEAELIQHHKSLNGLYQDYIDQHPTMNDLLAHVAKADLLISSGTGPAHLAAALGIPVLTLFPPIPKIGELRWRPVGESVHCLTAPTGDGDFCNKRNECSNKDCACMQALSVDKVLLSVNSILNININK